MKASNALLGAILSLCLIGAFTPALAQDFVVITVVDGNELPMTGQDFRVAFYWTNGQNSFWGPNEVPNEEGGVYEWEIPEPEDGFWIINYKAICPSQLDPQNPATYEVVKVMNELEWEWKVDW